MKENEILRIAEEDKAPFYVTNVNIAIFRCNQYEEVQGCIEYDGGNAENCIYYEKGACNNCIMNAIAATKIASDIFNLTEQFSDKLKMEINEENTILFKDQNKLANLHLLTIFAERLISEREENNE